MIIYQTGIITANIIFAVAVVLSIFFLVIKPMNSALHAIERNDEVHSYGSRELNYIVDDSTDTLFKKADQALYKVKQSGKSGVIFDK